MAPFKLKFRMGSSRSTSQEQDNVVDTQTQTQIFLNNYGSNTTIDSDPNTDSLISLNNDQRALLHNSNDTTDGQIGKNIKKYKKFKKQQHFLSLLIIFSFIFYFLYLTNSLII